MPRPSVEFVVARGGVDVAKQIGVGNAPIGGLRAELVLLGV